MLRRIVNRIFRHANDRQFVLSATILYVLISSVMYFSKILWLQANWDFWQRMMDQLYSDFQQYAIIFVFVAVFMKILTLLICICAQQQNARDWTTNHTSQLEVKKSYAGLIFKRLLARLDEIERQHNFQDFSELPLEELIAAREEMQLAIDQFRLDARKLLRPNQHEVKRPIEEVYKISDEDWYMIRKSRFSNIQIELSDDVLQYFVNPTDKY